MKLLKSVRKAINEKNKKALIIMFTTFAVVVASFTAGAVYVGTELTKGNSAYMLSKKESPTALVVEKASSTEKSTDETDKDATESAVNYTIKLAKTKAAISTGDTYSVELADGMDKSKYNLTWSSDNKAVATVDKNGNITGISDGKANITCTSLKDNANAVLQVTVSTPVYPDGITLDKDTYTLTSVGELLKLNATLTPQDDVTETKLKWSSSDKSVATVKNGVVTAVAEGVTTISCTTANDISAECVVTVKNIIKTEEIYIDYIAYDFDGPQTESVKLTAYVYPENATNSQVIWHSTNENIAHVDDDGNVTIVGDGECEVIATTSDGTYLSAECKITAQNTMAVVTHQAGTNVYVPVNPVVANTVLEEALRYVGKIPYVWGGTDLATGVDCSGFICAVYQRFGINLWGVRTDLYLAGTEVASIEEAKAGDILCYPGHVAIYDGNGGRVHAYDTGYMIMHDTNIGGYYTIRRIIQ